MLAPKTRACPCCSRPIVAYRVLCSYCTPLVPFDIRAELSFTFHSRRRQPHLHEEALLKLYVWRSETNMGAWRREEDHEG